ncbi:MAG: arylsulfatase [Flavihumibacter sp.]
MKKAIFGLACLLAISANAQQKNSAAKPNIILIMSDDMGYSDIGCYGSEIETPNLDRLAANGIRFRQFYNQARCCPTRASLMTGLYPHQAGMGWMDAVNHNLPGYQAQLNKNAVTIAEVLSQQGYSTYMSGKWHLQFEQDTRQNSPNYNWPVQRGFQRFYGILKGGGSFYDPATLCRDNTLISPYNDPLYKPEHYYFTDAITDNAVRFIGEDKGQKPFFLYLSYTTAHWPLQAPEKAIAKYKGKYDQGWEKVQQARLAKMKKLKLIDEQVQLPPFDSHSWEEEQYKESMARRMETYAAMVDIMDQGIGRVLDELKKKGILENTVIIFLEDNGGNAEGIGYGGPNGAGKFVAADTSKVQRLTNNDLQWSGIPPITRDGKFLRQGLSVMAGPPDTYLSYLRPWAIVSNTPFRRFKHHVNEGGISTPLIVHWPAGIKAKGEYRDQVGNVIDMMPTILDLAGATYPTTSKGNPVTPVAGVSLRPAFSNQPVNREAIYWEHEMNRAVRMGDWKLVSVGHLTDGGYGTWKNYTNERWQLFNMKIDRTEQIDFSAARHDLVKKMAAMWQEWTKTVPVYPTPWTHQPLPLAKEYIDDGL